MSEQLTKSLNTRIGAANLLWQPVFNYHGSEAPWHQVLAQVMAVIDSPDDIRYVDSEIANERSLSKLSLDMVIFTDKWILHSTMAPLTAPVLDLIPRARIEALQINEVPADVVPRNTPSEYHRVTLQYPGITLSLPFDSDRSGASDALGRLLPSLIADLLTSAAARGV